MSTARMWRTGSRSSRPPINAQMKQRFPDKEVMPSAVRPMTLFTSDGKGLAFTLDGRSFGDAELRAAFAISCTARRTCRWTTSSPSIPATASRTRSPRRRRRNERPRSCLPRPRFPRATPKSG